MADAPDTPAPSDPNERIARLEADNERLAREVKRLVKTEVELFESHRQLDQQLRIYEHLYEVGKVFNATFNREAILQKAVRFPVYELGFERAVMLGRGRDGRYFVAQASEGYYGATGAAQIASIQLDLDTLLPGIGVGTEIVGLGADMSEAARALGQAVGLVEFAAYPVGGEPAQYEALLVGGNSGARLSVYNRVQPGSGILVGMANFASHVSTAMRHSLAYRELEGERQLLEDKVRERTAELEIAHDKLLRYEKESLEMQMAGGFAHEMRNAIGAVETVVSVALDDVAGRGGGSLTKQNATLLEKLFVVARAHLPKPELAEAVELTRRLVANEEQLEKILHSVRAASQRALGITSSLLEYSRLGRSTPGSDRIDLRRLCEAVVVNSRGMVERHRIEITVTLPKKLAVIASETHLYSMVSNLVNNACDALGELPSGARRLELALTSDPDGVLVRVTDTAAGISPHVLPRIFDPFFSTKPKTGAGLGLGVVKKLVELYDGTITVESQVGVGTTFALRFPTAMVTE